MTRLASLACLFVIASLSGCSSAVGCDFRDVKEGLNNGPEPRCQERTGLQAATFGGACEALSATVLNGGCPHEGIVFGCNLGTDVVDWYYAPKTRADAEQECGNDPIVEAP